MHDSAHATYVICNKGLNVDIGSLREKGLKTLVAPLIRARSVVQVHPGPPLQNFREYFKSQLSANQALAFGLHVQADVDPILARRHHE